MCNKLPITDLSLPQSFGAPCIGHPMYSIVTIFLTKDWLINFDLRSFIGIWCLSQKANAAFWFGWIATLLNDSTTCSRPKFLASVSTMQLFILRHSGHDQLSAPLVQALKQSWQKECPHWLILIGAFKVSEFTKGWKIGWLRIRSLKLNYTVLESEWSWKVYGLGWRYTFIAWKFILKETKRSFTKCIGLFLKSIWAKWYELKWTQKWFQKVPQKNQKWPYMGQKSGLRGQMAKRRQNSECL